MIDDRMTLGALLVVNSSMTSMDVFANLATVGLNGQLATFMLKKYEIVVSGM